MMPTVPMTTPRTTTQRTTERVRPLFVMNTAAEIDEAIADFNGGRMGSIPAAGVA